LRCSQDFLRCSQGFLRDSQGFLRGSQNFMRRSQNFMRDSQTLMSGSKMGAGDLRSRVSLAGFCGGSVKREQKRARDALKHIKRRV
jgi:hypothetical protein